MYRWCLNTSNPFVAQYIIVYCFFSGTLNKGMPLTVGQTDDRACLLKTMIIAYRHLSLPLNCPSALSTQASLHMSLDSVLQISWNV